MRFGIGMWFRMRFWIRVWFRVRRRRHLTLCAEEKRKD
jgi:hypothetical protein